MSMLKILLKIPRVKKYITKLNDEAIRILSNDRVDLLEKNYDRRINELTDNYNRKLETNAKDYEFQVTQLQESYEKMRIKDQLSHKIEVENLNKDKQKLNERVGNVAILEDKYISYMTILHAALGPLKIVKDLLSKVAVSEKELERTISNIEAIEREVENRADQKRIDKRLKRVTSGNYDILSSDKVKDVHLESLAKEIEFDQDGK